MRGGEKVLEAISELYPSVDIYTHVLEEEKLSDRLQSHSIETTFVDSLPFSKQFYQYYLPFMPMGLESLDLRDYDLVISSESGPAKGVITKPSTLHICYCHSPMRYLWDMKEEYFGNSNILKKIMIYPMLHYLRMWDQLSANRVDEFICNSSFVSKRIKKCYRRQSEIIFPPVEIDRFSPQIKEDSGGYFLCVGELVSYKKVDIAIQAFNELGLTLKVVGSGEERTYLEDMAEDNIDFLGYLPDDYLVELYQKARALVFPGKEDFGIVPVEAMAAGCPVIAYGEGGVVDSVEPGVTGLFFDNQNKKSLQQTVKKFIETEEEFNRKNISKSVESFGKHRFKKEFKRFVNRKCEEFFGSDG
jgi:glycosyltransferase involved in cell wall biosynthesis